MALFIALIAALAYAMQNVLLAPLYRDHHPLKIVAIRGLTLGLSMLPLVILAGWRESVETLTESSDLLLFVCILTAIGNAFNGMLYKQFSVGVASALGQAALVLTITLLGSQVFGEVLTLFEYGCMLLVLGGSLTLAMLQVQSAQFQQVHWGRGILAACGFGLSLGTAFVTLISSARDGNPFASAYFWELGTGLVSLVLFLLGGALGRIQISFPSLEMLSSITWRSSLTLFGTGCFVYASTLLPVAISSTISSLQFIFGALIAKFTLGERLTPKQWAIIIMIFASIAGLKLW